MTFSRINSHWQPEATIRSVLYRRSDAALHSYVRTISLSDVIRHCLLTIVLQAGLLRQPAET